MFDILLSVITLTLLTLGMLGSIQISNFLSGAKHEEPSLPRWQIVDHELRCPHGQAVVCRKCGVISDMLHEIHMGISCETCELLLNGYFRKPLPATIEEVYLQKLKGDDLVDWGRDVIDKAVLQIDHAMDDASAQSVKADFNSTCIADSYPKPGDNSIFAYNYAECNCPKCASEEPRESEEERYVLTTKRRWG